MIADAPELAPWQTVDSRVVYSNPWITVREDDVRRPDGTAGIYGVVRAGPCVGVLPFVDDDHVALVRQWRYVTKQTSWEMPTGAVHDGEDPHDAAQRELAEEAGYRAGTLRRVSTFNTSKSVVDETAHLFIATSLTEAVADADETEFIERHVVPFDQAMAWTIDGTIVDSMTVIAILLADRERRIVSSA